MDCKTTNALLNSEIGWVYNCGSWVSKRERMLSYKVLLLHQIIEDVVSQLDTQVLLAYYILHYIQEKGASHFQSKPSVPTRVSLHEQHASKQVCCCVSEGTTFLNDLVFLNKSVWFLCNITKISSLLHRSVWLFAFSCAYQCDDMFG